MRVHSLAMKIHLTTAVHVTSISGRAEFPVESVLYTAMMSFLIVTGIAGHKQAQVVRAPKPVFPCTLLIRWRATVVFVRASINSRPVRLEQKMPVRAALLVSQIFMEMGAIPMCALAIVNISSATDIIKIEQRT